MLSRWESNLVLAIEKADKDSSFFLKTMSSFGQLKEMITEHLNREKKFQIFIKPAIVNMEMAALNRVFIPQCYSEN